MYLLLAASVLLQDKTAEETFKKIEEQFEKAKTISVRLKIKVEEEHTSVVFLAGEGNKFGFKTETLRAEIGSLLALPRLSIEGLMCIPPLTEEAEASRKFFVQLRDLRNSLEKEFDVKFPHLSMGMTQDFWIAVEEGATLVRVGTAIFGERPKRQND